MRAGINAYKCFYQNIPFHVLIPKDKHWTDFKQHFWIANSQSDMKKFDLLQRLDRFSKQNSLL